MVVTQTKCSLHFTGPSTKAGDTKDLNEVTSHHKGEGRNRDDPIVKDGESRENIYGDVEDDPQDTPKDDHHQDKAVVVLEERINSTKAVMIALTKGNQTAQTTPTNDAFKKADPKDPGTSNPRKDKGKGKIGETSKKASQTKQRKKSKIANQPPQKKKGNHASGQGN
uniref:Uncharacterized protein n=1 Tax=Cannabis sativa TaxID=3483 RepID=A0A803PMS2_CANSA